MRTIHVETGRAYDVTVGRGLLADLGKTVAKAHPACRAALVTDDRVWPLYGEGAVRALEASGISVSVFTFPNGESSKTPETWLQIIRFLAREGFSRKDVVVALGGGVVGDMAGFAAATYMRGMAFYQVPTTFLAMLDASVGGKTAVDLPEGKNLLGAFWQPDAVLMDVDLLASLPADVFSDGVAEAIKTGILFDPDLFALLETGDFSNSIEDILAAAVAHKARVVEQDEREGGLRRLLNLGHTFGHAIEKLSGFGLRHGQAVAIGTAVIARAAQVRGLLSKEEADRIEKAFRKNSLPTETEFAAETIAQAAANDKKSTGKGVALVVPRSIGRCEVVEVPFRDLADWCRYTRAAETVEGNGV